MSYIILRGRWCHIIVLNVPAPTEDKADDVKYSFYEELESMFDKFPKYHTKILLGDFNAKLCKEDIFKPTIGNESLHETSNGNGVRLVNLATSKNLRVKSTMFSHHNIHKYTWTAPDGKTRNQIDHILVHRRRHLNALDVRPYRAADCDTDHCLVVEKVSERLAVNKQRSHRFRMERFDLKKLNEVEGKERPPLWSSGQRPWLQIRRPGFDSQHYQKKVVGLERGPLSLVSTTKELPDRKVAAPV
jgi:hypothetical protein